MIVEGMCIVAKSNGCCTLGQRVLAFVWITESSIQCLVKLVETFHLALMKIAMGP